MPKYEVFMIINIEAKDEHEAFKLVRSNYAVLDVSQDDVNYIDFFVDRPTLVDDDASIDDYAC